MFFFCLFVYWFTSGLIKKGSREKEMSKNPPHSREEFVYLPGYALSLTAKWPNMGILLEQEVGAIGRLRADVSVHVRGGGAVCSTPLCLLDQKNCSPFLDIFEIYCH